MKIVERIVEADSLSECIRRILDLTEPKKLLAPRDSAAVDRTLTLSAAHRLIAQLADDTLSRETLAECRDVMSQLERMVEDA